MKKTIKIIFITLVVAILILLVLRIVGSEDDWMCENGKWIKHGNPSAPAPEKDCE